MPAKRKHDIPYQLLSWHEHVAFERDRHPHLPYKEVLQLASQTYRGGMNAHDVAGRKRRPARRGGYGEDPHDIAGKRKRGRGPVGAVTGVVKNLADMLGLGEGGRKRKAPARKRMGGEEGGKRKRAAGPLGALTGVVKNVADALGLGRKPAAKKSRRRA